MNLVELNYNRNKKLAICNECDEYNTVTKQCKICKCVMPFKTWIPGNNCPLNKHEVVFEKKDARTPHHEKNGV